MDSLADQFKPEIRRKGAALVSDLVLSASGDTNARAFVKGAKVSLSAEGIEASLFSAVCSCGEGACKHIWATLLKLESSDFLRDKTGFEIAEAGLRKAKYKMEAREKQKVRAKEQRASARASARVGDSPAAPDYPKMVGDARAYFHKNGFLLESHLDMEELLSAKKQLSRVFHPDMGGSHDETVELNRNFEIIRDYLRPIA